MEYLLSDIVIHKPPAYSSVYDCWGGWLLVSHFCEGNAHDFPYFEVDK